MNYRIPYHHGAPITVDIVRDDVVIKPRSKCGDAA